MAKGTCSVAACEGTFQARGLCRTHYSQWRRTTLADPVAAKAWASEQRGLAVKRQQRVAATEKLCSKCRSVQHKSEFSRTPRTSDGRHSWCKECLRKLAKANYDPDAKREKHQRLKCDPRYKAIRKAAYDRWRAEHPDRATAATRAWRAKRREHVLAVRRAWAEANRDGVRLKRRGYSRARRQRTSGAGVDYSTLLAGHGMACHICGGDIASMADLHFDHVIPLARGGAHSAENIRPSHAVCNMRKGARIA